MKFALLNAAVVAAGLLAALVVMKQAPTPPCKPLSHKTIVQLINAQRAAERLSSSTSCVSLVAGSGDTGC